MQNLLNALRTSEFWLGVVAALGQTGVLLKLWSQEDWNTFLYPALVYIVGRITSKVVKAA